MYEDYGENVGRFLCMPIYSYFARLPRVKQDFRGCRDSEQIYAYVR